MESESGTVAIPPFPDTGTETVNESGLIDPSEFYFESAAFAIPRSDVSYLNSVNK
jgi:hypothetical protein